MRVYQNSFDGFLYSLKWVQERMGDPAVIYAISRDQSGKTIRNANRMDFVTLSSDALSRSRRHVPPVDPTSDTSSVER